MFGGRSSLRRHAAGPLEVCTINTRTIAFAVSTLALSPIQLTASENYCNGRTARIGSTRYYPNGKTVNIGSAHYYPNGQALDIGTSLYYPNGQAISIGSSYYFPNGRAVNIGSTYYYPNGQTVNIGSTYYNDTGVATDRPPQYVTFRDGEWTYRFPVMAATDSFFLSIREGEIITRITVEEGRVEDVEAECE